MEQPNNRRDFDQRVPLDEPHRRFVAPTSRPQPEPAEPRQFSKVTWLFWILGLGALAYLVLAGNQGAILIIVSILGALFSLLVAWGVWIMNNVLLR